MLTRFWIGDFRIFARGLSDKPSGNDGKTPENKFKVTETQSKPQSSTEKIQQLLKLMMAEHKFKESEYKDKLTTALDRTRKQKDVIEIKTEKTVKYRDNTTISPGDVAQALGGDLKQTECELLSMVLGKINKTYTNLSDHPIDMKIDHTKKVSEREVIPSYDSSSRRFFIKTMKKANETRYMQRKIKELAKQATDDGKDKCYTPINMKDLFDHR